MPFALVRVIEKFVEVLDAHIMSDFTLLAQEKQLYTFIENVGVSLEH